MTGTASVPPFSSRHPATDRSTLYDRPGAILANAQASSMAAAQLPLLKGIDPTGTDRDAVQLLDLVERVTGCGAWLLEPRGRRLTMTERLAALLKLPRTAARSISLDEALEFYAPESRAAIAAAFSACLEQAVPLNLESELVTYNGERLWVRTVGRAVRDRAGALVRIQGMVQDLTEKHRAEQENLSATLRLSLTMAS
ncbi:MAG: PAS domain S-box protein, partial [Proteobacteria bacterium]|nr:PAS domain S-box protein [Pseudomonadota bacterium]